MTFAFWSARELAIRQGTSTGHAITDLEVRCVVGFCPMSLDLRVGTTNKTVFSATVLNESRLQYFSTSLSSNERHHHWRVVFLFFLLLVFNILLGSTVHTRLNGPEPPPRQADLYVFLCWKSVTPLSYFLLFEHIRKIAFRSIQQILREIGFSEALDSYNVCS